VRGCHKKIFKGNANFLQREKLLVENKFFSKAMFVSS
jgi:hypothetical protein